MEKVIEIDGKQVKFRATAAIPRLYRIKFGRDILQDIAKLKDAMVAKDTEETPIPQNCLQIFEDVAYIMAKHGDPEMTAKSPEEWLDNFETFSIYAVLPAILALWAANVATLSESKKKRDRSTGK